MQVKSPILIGLFKKIEHYNYRHATEVECETDRQRCMHTLITNLMVQLWMVIARLE